MSVFYQDRAGRGTSFLAWGGHAIFDLRLFTLSSSKGRLLAVSLSKGRLNGPGRLLVIRHSTFDIHHLLFPLRPTCPVADLERVERSYVEGRPTCPVADLELDAVPEPVEGSKGATSKDDLLVLSQTLSVSKGVHECH